MWVALSRGALRRPRQREQSILHSKHPSRTAAVCALFLFAVLRGAVAPGAAAALTLTRGPYLQRLTSGSVTIVWKTDEPAVCGLALRPLGGTPMLVPGPLATVCAIPVTGLTPGASYAYAPLGSGLPLDAESVFRTDSGSTSFSFLVVGDSGCSCASELRVRDAMQATPADLIVHTGDMVYEDGAAPVFDAAFFAPYRELIRKVVFWPVLGNHDVHTALGAPWIDAFYTPANNLAGADNYYSFDYGNAHFVVLDSNAPLKSTSAQYRFLDDDLAASTAEWKFVVFHHTIYSTGAKHGSNTSIRNSLVPVFDARGVDVVLMGHEHNYERTHSMRANQVVPDGEGTLYITTGGGGQDLYGFEPSAAFTAHAESTYHFVRVDIRGDALRAQMIRDDGSIGDTVTLVRGAPLPPPVCGNGVVDQPSEQCDGPDHPACTGGCAPDCTCLPICGDGRVDEPAETCDGPDDAACPGLCLSDCQCGDPSRFVTLAPVADTYIEAGIAASWDHGAADHLEVDELPLDITYLKFDLSDLPDRVTAASLTLRCIGGSNGGTIVPVPDSSWIEGGATGQDAGSAAGLGLKWTDVDTSLDGIVDMGDTSPWVPDFTRAMRGFGTVAAGQSVTADVTPAFRSGPGIYSLAVTIDGDSRGSYAARESATPPALRVELGTTTTTSTSSSTSTSSTSSSSSSSTSSSTSTSSSSTTSSTSSTSTSSSSSSTSSSSTSTTSSTSSSSTSTTSTSSSTSTTSSSATSSSSTSSTRSTTSTTTSSTSSTRPDSPTTSTSSSTSSTASTTSSSTSTSSTSRSSTSMSSTTSSTGVTNSTTSSSSSTVSTSTRSTTTSSSTTSSSTVTSSSTSTTASTAPSSTSTSTTVPAPACVADGDCRDGDPCTLDQCAAGVCRPQAATGFAAVGCVFDGEASVTAACGGQGPRALWRRVDRARGFFIRARRAQRPAALVRRALRMLDRADQVRYRSVTRGTINEACSSAVTRFVRRVQGGAARWQAEPSFPR